MPLFGKSLAFCPSCVLQEIFLFVLPPSCCQTNEMISLSRVSNQEPRASIMALFWQPIVYIWQGRLPRRNILQRLWAIVLQRALMASLGIYTPFSQGTALFEPSTILLRPSPLVLSASSANTEAPLCWHGSAFSPCSVAPQISLPADSGLDPGVAAPLAPMPFASPFTSHLVATLNPTHPTAASVPHSLLPEVSALPTASGLPPSVTGTKPSLASPSRSEDPMMHGNPEPKHPRLHTPVTICVIIVSILAAAILPLLAFSAIMNVKLNRAIRLQLARGARRQAFPGFTDSEVMGKDRTMDDRLIDRFRRRIEQRAFIRREHV